MKKRSDIPVFSPKRYGLSLIDRYIIGKFFVTTLFVHFIIIAIAIVIDLSDKMENFVERKAPGDAIFYYYLNFIPYIASILAPFLIFLAVIFFTSRMASNSEIIAMTNGGLTFRRFLRPYILCGFFSVATLLYANHWLVPQANRARLSFEDTYVHAPKNYSSGIHLKIDKNTFVSIERFNFSTGEGFNFAIERYTGNGADRNLVTKINANKIVSEKGKNNWRLLSYQRWDIDGAEEHYVEGRQLDTILKLQPKDFVQDLDTKDALNYSQIEHYIHSEKERGGNDVQFYRVEQYRRTSSAISVFILVIMGAALSSKKIRGGNWFGILAGIALSALYIFFLQFSSTFSTNGNLPPVIGTNIPNIIFGIIAVLLVRYASR